MVRNSSMGPPSRIDPTMNEHSYRYYGAPIRSRNQIRVQTESKIAHLSGVVNGEFFIFYLTMY